MLLYNIILVNILVAEWLNGWYTLIKSFIKSISFNIYSELKKLSEESLARPPEEVFDIICKLGEGSYGSVYKALHKESGVVRILCILTIM